ncbi:hypothetical protein RMSM_00609 [Rhodopirellula maiorica SM1]|uniref:Uncharacterized protein n=1 Tax=Rhodopirellula maiorica SM1 TaxID=1265738 RepID=M5RT44_9BACT|nr:hypothetical protein RMSM_00609 [Rhodopirellula maiorica SM1]
MTTMPILSIIHSYARQIGSLLRFAQLCSTWQRSPGSQMSYERKILSGGPKTLKPLQSRPETVANDENARKSDSGGRQFAQAFYDWGELTSDAIIR